MKCSCFKSLWNGLTDIAEGLQSLLLLGIRLFVGYQFFISGLGKLNHLSDVTSFFNQLGIPFPELNAYFVASTECVGGILLVLGLCTRPAALLLIILMLVALLTAHQDAVRQIYNNPAEFTSLTAFHFLVACLFLFAFGPGKLSVDSTLGRWLFNTRS